MKFHGTRERGAFLSDDTLGPDGRGQYRYLLHRWWGPGRRFCLFVMLNPSTAEGLKDDPTMLAVIAFCKAWGFDGVIVCNLFAMRSSHPSDIVKHPNPVGHENRRALLAAMPRCSMVIAAWGATTYTARADDMRLMLLAQWFKTIHCLGTTDKGAPKHPLARGKHRIPRDQAPLVWRERRVS